MNAPKIAAVILAAGKGTRMKSNKAKVLHELFFKPMLHHVLDAVASADIHQTAVVVGHQGEEVLASLADYSFTAVYQEEQLGTGHAVLCAESACHSADMVMILCGDTPLIQTDTLQAMIRQHRDSNATLTLMTTKLDEPFGYGRIISDSDGRVLKIVEEKDADETQRAIREINAGIYLADTAFLFSALKEVGTDNSQGEVYLTDIVAIAGRKGNRIRKFVHPEAIDILGVNSRIELARAHLEMQMRHNSSLMLNGVTMYSPETILIAPDCMIGRDTIIQTGVQVTGGSNLGSEVFLEAGSVVHKAQLADRCVIGANSVLHNCTIEPAEHIPPLTYRVG